MRDRDEDWAELGNLTATPMRERGERDGRRYWRIRDRERRTVASGWWTRDELDGAIAVALTSPRRTGRDRSEGGATVADVLALWRTAQITRHGAGEIADATLRNYRDAVRSWLATDLASMLATRLTRAHVVDQGTTWRAAGVAARTVDLQIRILRLAVRWGSDRGHCPKVDLVIPSTAHDDEHVYSGRVPTRAELVAVLGAIQPGPRRDAIEILGLTGARVGEVAALRVGDVDLVTRTLRLSGRDEARGRRGKTKARLFPLRGRLLELVTELITEVSDGRRLVPDLEDGRDGTACPVQPDDAGRGTVLGEARDRDLRPRDALGRACQRDGRAREEGGTGGGGAGSEAGATDRLVGQGGPKGLTDRLLGLPASAPQVLGDEIERGSRAAGVEPLTPHGIRRLVVGELLEAANGNAKRVSRLTGHSVVVLLRHYVRPTQDELGSLVEVAQLGVEVVDNVRPMKRRE